MVKAYGRSADEVARLLRNGKIKVDLVGIGNMGLPVAVALAKEGIPVIGVRTKQDLVDQINQGKCPLVGEPQIPDLLKEQVQTNRLHATTDGVAAAREADIIIILVPLVVDSQGKEDYSLIETATVQIGKGLEKGDLVISSTTMPPGATAKVIKPILERVSGLKAGVDFGLAHSPERLMVGRVLRNLYRFPKIIGGIDKASCEAAAGLYSLFGTVVRTSSIITAELVKVAEGTYRDLNISYANLLAKLCEPLGVDVWEVIAAANKDTNEHCMIHRPGPGVGGHCLPVYPWFLINKAKELGVNATLLRQGRHINDTMPAHTVELVIRCLNAQGKSIKGAQIGILGVSFRGNVKEIRFAPSFQILSHLREFEPAGILAHDPFFTEQELRNYGFIPATLDEVIKTDCIILIAPHSVFQKAKAKLQKVKDRLIDTTNSLPDSIWKLGSIPYA